MKRVLAVSLLLTASWCWGQNGTVYGDPCPDIKPCPKKSLNGEAKPKLPKCSDVDPRAIVGKGNFADVWVNGIPCYVPSPISKPKGQPKAGKRARRPTESKESNK